MKNPFIIILKTCRIFYYEGIHGLLIRVRGRLIRKTAITDSTVTRDSERKVWEKSILNGLEATKMVVLDDFQTVDEKLDHNSSNLTLLMLVPPPERGSGGRMTMARILKKLTESGIKCYVAFYPEVPDHNFKKYEHEWMDEFDFAPNECSILKYAEATERSFDIAVATFWPSAYAIKYQIKARSKGYLVQDFEPYFYPPGSHYAFSEDSYRLGLWGLCASPWLAKKLSQEYKMQTVGFELGVDKREYHQLSDVKRDKKLVIAYIRQHTERRGYELVMWSLKKIKEQVPDVRIEVFGDPHLPIGDFLWIDKNHGILSHEELCKLYNYASVGIVTSFTNYSLIPNEMISCGCAVVDLDTECMKSVFPDAAISLAHPTPKSIADAVKKLLHDNSLHESQVLAGLKYIEKVDWERSLEKINIAVRNFSKIDAV
ncbi:glycosyltransferase [Paenochrobactrum glaciei]|uniref:WsaF C-terminal domain-containing protein n=1 Tax=Paenochrobactrum glaciei TaxID=486407 RepID=A0ABN1GQD2_9HYPH